MGVDESVEGGGVRGAGVVGGGGEGEAGGEGEVVGSEDAGGVVGGGGERGAIAVGSMSGGATRSGRDGDGRAGPERRSGRLALQVARVKSSQRHQRRTSHTPIQREVVVDLPDPCNTIAPRQSRTVKRTPRQESPRPTS